jgi:hypothetical protein
MNFYLQSTNTAVPVFVQDEKGNLCRETGSSYAKRENLPYRKCCTRYCAEELLGNEEGRRQHADLDPLHRAATTEPVSKGANTVSLSTPRSGTTRTVGLP